MKGKLEFGCDYLQIMRELISRGGSENPDPIADATAKLFLLQWGFTVEEIDQSNKLWFDRLSAKELENDLLVVINRIKDYIKDDRPAQERFIIEMAAVGAIDAKVTDDEAGFVRGFLEIFDLRPSEFQELCKQGSDWSIALNYFGKEYAKAKYNVTV